MFLLANDSLRTALKGQKDTGCPNGIPYPLRWIDTAQIRVIPSSTTCFGRPATVPGSCLEDGPIALPGSSIAGLPAALLLICTLHDLFSCKNIQRFTPPIGTARPIDSRTIAPPNQRGESSEFGSTADDARFQI